MKKKKATGKYEIPNEAWISGKVQIMKDYRIVINKIQKGKSLPGEWKGGTIVPIFKKRDKKCIANYKGITLMDTGNIVLQIF